MTVFASAKEEDVDHTVFPEPVALSRSLSLRSLSSSKGRRVGEGLSKVTERVSKRAFRQACIDRLSTGNDHVSAGSTAAVEDVNDRLLTEICKDAGRVLR